MTTFLPTLRRLAVALSLTATAAQAQVVWSDNFTGQTVGAFPSGDFPGGTPGPDYASTASSVNANFNVDGGIGNSAPSLAVIDTGTAGADVATLQITMDHFAPFDVSPTSATPILRVSFDARVDSYLSALSTNIPRFILRADNINNTGSQIVIAFGHASLNDGDADEDLVLYADTATAATTNTPPKNSSAIGLISGTGWQTGFNFGTYDAVDATLNDTNDEFYRITFDYDSITGAITGSARQLSTGMVGNFQPGLSFNPGTSFSNTSAAPDRFLFSSSAPNTATAYFDNFVFQAIPEPATAMLLLGGAALIGKRRPHRCVIA